MKPKNRKKAHRDRPTLPELDQTKKSVFEQSDVDPSSAVRISM